MTQEVSAQRVAVTRVAEAEVRPDINAMCPRRSIGDDAIDVNMRRIEQVTRAAAAAH